MAWQIPGAAGQWTPAMGMSQEINMGSYTAEQWAVIQQQNWQQWTQWQQYSQWQSQYGEKYAQQLQASQPVPGMPPLPVGAAAPPAPPPPDQPPPPPPPHENNQPLYGNSSQSVTPALRNTTNHSNTESTTGNNQWSYGTEAPKEAPSTINKDALKKLAEEEKSFDIQFQKWEEEIERWRQENVNHPDRRAYQEYEERFELCRAQLLERRKQMQQKRDRLLNPVLPTTNTPSGNTPTQAPAPTVHNPQANYKQSVPPQNFQNKSYQQDYNTQSTYNQSRSNNKNIDPQDRYESYDNMDSGNRPSQKDTYPSAKSDPATFLPTSSTGKSIPGLDLVPDSSQGHKIQDVIDITDDPNAIQLAPDYSKISKGINNILGDAKIMNILSMVQGQNIPPPNTGQNVSPNAPLSSNNQNYPQNQGNRNQNNFEQNQQYGNTQNMPYNRQGLNFPMQQNQGMNSQQQGIYDNAGQDVQQSHFGDRNASYHGPNNRGGSEIKQGGPGIRPAGFDIRQGGPDMRQGGPDMRQGGLDLRQGGLDMRQGGPDMRQGGPDLRLGGLDMRQGGPDMRQSGLDLRQGGPDLRQGGPDMRQGGPDMRQGGPDMRQGGPDMRQGRPDMRPGGTDMRPGVPDVRQDGLIWDGGNMRPGGPDMRQGGPDIRSGGPGMRHGGPNMRQGGADMKQGGPDMRQTGPDMRQGGPDMRQGGPDMRQSGLDLRQGGPDLRQGGPDMRQGGPDMRQGGPDMRQGGPDMRQGGPNMRQGGPDMNQGGTNNPSSLLQDLRRPGPNNQAVNNNGSIPSLMAFNSRPPLQDMSSQQNVDDFYSTEQPMAINNAAMNQPTRPKWVEEPLFAPSLVVDYEHKPLRLKARDFIEPVHTFDYNHRSKDGELNKKKDFEKEIDELFTRKPKREDPGDRYVKDLYYRDYERRGPREEVRDIRDTRDMREEYRDLRDDFRGMRGPRDLPREPPREDFERRRVDDRFEERRRDDIRDFRRDDSRDMRRDDSRDMRRDDSRDMRRDDFRDMRRDDFRDMRRDDSRDMRREDSREFRRDDRREDRRDDRRDDRERFYRREDIRERDRDRDLNRMRDDRSRDIKRDDHKHRSKSKEADTRKRGLSKESDGSTSAKKTKDNKVFEKKEKKHIVMIDDILEPPGRDMRPEKLVIIIRGLPGSGKSYLAKLIRDREAEHGGTARIMSIDDYFMQEGETEERDPVSGKMVKKPYLKYEYDESAEESYLTSLKRAFKRSLTDGYFNFLIYDAVNDQLKHYADIWNFARQSGFQVYICTMEQDVQTCFKRNIHNRKLEDLEVLKARFFDTPPHHIELDATTLLQSASIQDVHMEDVEDDVIMEDVQEVEVESVFTSKWEKMDDAVQLARLDGTSKPLRPSQPSMADYLQLDEWKPNVAKPGKKTVRWADIEERRKQEKMRAIGFVVGQTDWNRMNDPTMGSSALTQTKYIERVRRQ